MLGALLLGARQRAFTCRQSKTTARAKMKLPRMARTQDENIFVRRRQWNSSAKASPARSSAALCEIFATL
jgi:hypothetical protein